MAEVVNDAPAISVIIPSAGGETLERCLLAVKANAGPFIEILVVDDSPGGSVEVPVRADGVRRVRSRGGEGAAAARNMGAREASGGVLVFVDDDVVVPPDALDRLFRPIAHGEAEAVVAIYGAPPPGAGAATVYKHLWIMWSYLRAPDRIDWIFASTFGVGRSAFERAGGFDERRSARTGTDDLELGMRLHAAGARILLDKGLRTTHLKRYTLAALLVTQYVRARSFTALALDRRRLAASPGRGFANVPPSFIAGVCFSWALPICGLVGAVMGGAWWCAPAAAAALWALSAAPFIRFARATAGVKAGAAAAPLTYLDHVVCGAGVAAGVLGGSGGRV